MKRSFLAVLVITALTLLSLITQCVSPNADSKSARRAACDTTNTGYFDITSPGAGDSVKMGSLDSIRWSILKSPRDSAVSLYLFKEKILTDTIALNIVNSGVFAWTVPITATGDGFRIKICGLRDTARHNFGCPFRLYSGYFGLISIVSPAAGAACTSGHSLRIQWKTLGTTGDSVTIQLLDDMVPMRIIAGKTRNSGTFTWQVPSGIAQKNTYRINITSSVDLAISDQSDLFSVISMAKDPFEPDNNMDSASIIDSLGKAQNHTLTGNDVDWIKFTSDSGKTYGIKITGDSGIGISIYSGKDSTLVKTLTPAGGKTAADSLFQWTSPKTGDYYLKISSPGDSAAAYKISIVQQQPVKTVVFLSPNALTVWIVGNSYSVKWLPDSAYLGNKVNIFIFKGSQQLQAIQSAYSNSGEVYYTVDPKLESGQDYRIRIVHGADIAKGGYSEYFTVKGCEPDPFEPDNKRESASKLTPDGKAQNHTFMVNDTDWIAFTVDSGKVYQMLFSGSVNAAIRLFYGSAAAPASDSVWEVIGPEVASLKWKCPKNGAWFARITFSPNAGGKDCGPYSFTMVDLTTTTGILPDAYEPDNKRDSASTLNPLGKAQARTLTVNDTDWVQCTFEGGTRYIIRSSGNIAMGVFIFSGVDIAPTTYFYNSSKSSALSWVCPKAGVWYARIAALSNIESGAYSFNASKFDTLAAVNFSSPTQGQTVMTGSTCQITWASDSVYLGTNVNLSIYKGTMKYANISTSINNSGSYAWDVPGYLSSGADYRVKIENYAQTELNGYSPVFTINATTLDLYEPNNQRDSATPFSPLGKPQTHNLTVNDTDWIVFAADSGKRYLVECRSAIPVMGLFYNDVNSYSTGSFRTMIADASTSSQFFSNQSGNCYIRVTPYSMLSFPLPSIGGSTLAGSYTINITPMDSLAATLSVTSPAAGSVWNAGSDLTIQWSGDNAGSGSYVSLQLYKGNTVVYSISSMQNTGTYSWNIPAAIASGSDYRTRVASSSYPASLTFFGYSPFFTINGAKPDAYEPDDSITQASTIVVDGPVQSRSLSAGDQDWIRFTAQKDSTYAIETTSRDSLSGGIQRAIYELNGSEPTYLIGDYMAIRPKFMWTCPKTGTYYLCISTFNSMLSSGDYTVSIKTYSFATSVKFINPAEGSVWQSGSSYLIQWFADTMVFGPNVFLQLYRDTTLAMDIGSTFNTGTYSFTLPSGMVTSSHYTMRLFSDLSPMTFKSSPDFTINGLAADAYEPDDYVEIARTISTKGTAESHSLTYADIDWFTFSADVDRLYMIKTIGQARSMATIIQLNDADWNMSSMAYSSTADSSATLFMLNENYETFNFSVTSSTTGAYKVAVSAYDSTKYGITVSSPRSGGSLIMGQTDTVRWSSQITPGGTVDIYLGNDSGWVYDVGAAAATGGSYAWTVPSTLSPGSGYYISIVNRFSARIFGLSERFTIKRN